MPYNCFVKYVDVALENLPANEEDLRAYFLAEFDTMKLSNNLNWPEKTDIEKLVLMSNPSFIFAATICRLVRNSRRPREKELKRILASPFGSAGSKLDDTYDPVMAPLTEDLDEQLKNQYRKLLEMIALLAHPLCVSAIASLLQQDEIQEDDDEDEMDAETIVRLLPDLCAVLYVPDRENAPVSMFHISFREYIMDIKPEKRNDMRKYWFLINEPSGHESIAERCLKLLSHFLKRNPCNFKSPGHQRSDEDLEVLDKHVSSGVQYACRFWVYHLLFNRSKDAVQDSDVVIEFLQSHFLHWIEHLAWMGRSSEGINMIISLKVHFEVFSSRQTKREID
jgi:hypothetical protein